MATTASFISAFRLYLHRYFKQDSAIEIAARDTLVKGYIKLKLNTADGVPLDDEEDPDAAVGEMTLDKVRVWGERFLQSSRFDRLPQVSKETVEGLLQYTDTQTKTRDFPAACLPVFRPACLSA